jgi:crossover junction endodeoxyribonuclease RuvC
MELSRRLYLLHSALAEIIRTDRPEAAAVEEVLGNSNAQSTLKLGQARGVVLLAAALAEVSVGEYHPSIVKKAVVGTGGAEKRQVQAMVKVLLPGAKLSGPDAADALAVAVTHAHHLASARAMRRVVA